MTQTKEQKESLDKAYRDMFGDPPTEEEVARKKRRRKRKGRKRAGG